MVWVKSMYGYGYGRGSGYGRGRGGPKWASPTEIGSQLETSIPPVPANAIRIAIPTVDDRGLESIVFQTFAHSPYITIVDVENGRIVACYSIRNPVASQARGAGRILMNYILGLGVRIIIATHIGPNMAMMLQQYGIAIYTTYPGIRVVDALRQYRLIH